MKLPVNLGSVYEAANASLVIRPNRSLSAAGVSALFVALSVAALFTGLVATLAGAWPVLPFALLQIVIAGVLCRWFYRHLDDCELVAIDEERVCVVRRFGKAVSRHEFPRAWARLRREAGADGSPRLLIGSHGKYVSLAEGVNEADRATIARELEALLHARREPRLNIH